MRKVTVTLACVAGASAIAVASAWAAAPATITSTSIAGAKLGLTASAYKQLLGNASTVSSNGFTVLTFTKREINVFLDESGKGVIIATWNKAYKTDRGIGPCSTVVQLKKAYGSKARPDHFANGPHGKFTWDVGKNLLFTSQSDVPAKTVTAVGLFNGSTPGANANGGIHPTAGFMTGFQSPACR